MGENILSDFGINLLEEEIDDVIFQTNEFLCDATFTGSQGPFWWLLKTVLCIRELPSDYHSFICLYRGTGLRRGTKTGQKRRKIKSKPSVLTVLSRTIIFADANIIICPESTKSSLPYLLTLNNFSYRGRYRLIFQDCHHAVLPDAGSSIQPEIIIRNTEKRCRFSDSIKCG